MNKLVEGNLFDENGSVISNELPPAIYNPLDALLAEYDVLKTQIEFISETAKKESRAFSHFLHGNSSRGIASFNVESIFDKEGAFRSLDATYWSNAMALTKTMDVFCAKNRNEWNNKIHEMKTPPFERQAVIDTLLNLMVNRNQFFAQKVDGVYRNLSRHHKTNSVFGFSERMILEYCIYRYGGLNHDQMNYVSDLRACIAIIRGIEPVASYTTYSDVDRILREDGYGKWYEFDAGAFRLRIYKKGTVHVEIHPDMSWKLNKVLAELYPAAIPSELREPPKKKFKEFELREETVDMEVRYVLNDVVRYQSRGEAHEISKSELSYMRDKKELTKKVESILRYLGGEDQPSKYVWSFGYKVRPVIQEIVRTGVIPNSVEYQYYPTPEALALTVQDLAEIDDEHTILEPSAGMGNLLANIAYKERITCIDISSAHCQILGAKEFTNVIEGDFLYLDHLGEFDRVLMNPPFSKGRAEAHLIKAFEHLKVGGILVAILPGSMHNKEILKCRL